MFMQKVSAIALACALILAGGCASAKVEPTQKASLNLPRPDRFIVNDFAVTPDDVKLDSGVMASAMRDVSTRTPDQDQVKVGRMVAARLAEKVAEELNKSGIAAIRAGNGARATDTTVILTGQFLNVDQGNQSGRVWLGFGIGGSELRTRAQLVQGGKLISEAQTRTQASLMPGMVVGLATGSAAGTAGTSAVTGAVGAGFSETFLASVEADANRTANEIVKQIKAYYADRGWATK